ncbi:MAG: hypothetical protein DI536_13400 [Archangium gephyra]|uniref:HTH luxR-type domain-containing protein n=1 Tax=Archangium gephyra TaxID=48 RepID=A0A2W5THJ1_9BACT|nr:MAG: hypothetical protein DI536_13400 [Archangium gephyra]
MKRAALVVLLLSAVGVGVWRFTTPRQASEAPARFLFRKLLPNWEVQRSRGFAPEQFEALQKAAEPWPGLKASFDELEAAWPEREAITTASNHLNLAARDAGLDFWVDPMVPGRATVITTYEILERVNWSVVTDGGVPDSVEAIHARRLDGINLEMGLLGHASGSQPAILRDRIEVSVLDRLRLDADEHPNRVERISAVIGFQTGVSALGSFEDRAVEGHDALFFGSSMELMTSWAELRHEDRISDWAFSNPGRTGAFDTSAGIYDGFTRIVEHCRRWGMAHILCTAVVDADTGLYWLFSLYRDDPSQPYCEDERSAMELLVPHIVSSSRRARVNQLRARTRAPVESGSAAVVANERGIILEAEPALPALLRSEWPAWRGPTLPAELLAAPRGERVVHGQLAFRADASHDVVLFHVRRAVPADALTAREREVAEVFASGASYLELAQTLKVAPNTARRHLSNIYEKLGISSKAELEKMLRD